MEFLWLLLESQFVFTNSFHGTIFAINFQIPFLCILNPASGGNSRIFSILTALGLSNRAVMDNEMVKGEAALAERIEFEVVHAKLADFRTVSQRFLKNALT